LCAGIYASRAGWPGVFLGNRLILGAAIVFTLNGVISIEKQQPANNTLPLLSFHFSLATRRALDPHFSF
jgi:hypothetical protein